MPIVADFYVSCEVCSRRSENHGVDIDEAEENARQDGWQIRRSITHADYDRGERNVLDLCPSCIEEAQGAIADEQAEREG